MLAEIVNLSIGYPEDCHQALIPVTIFDLESRRVRYQKVHRDQLEVMGDTKTAMWKAYWTGTDWRLIDIVPDTAEAA